ncbi:unnamed protein product [Clonostachys solani]|uniref:Uncharacterized protein n=1 Tax=Clonostachys solani TaxID=160281 RepID=A0A9P0EPC4_9HYPO|nr:unnamed protein product [Clonostachys solani]
MAPRPPYDPFEQTEEAFEASRDYIVEIHQIALLDEDGRMRYAFMTFDETARNEETGVVLLRKLATGHHGIPYRATAGRREGVEFVIQEARAGERGPHPRRCKSTPQPSDATLIARFHSSYELQLFRSVAYFSEDEGNLMLDDAEWVDGVKKLIISETSLDPYQAPDEYDPVLLRLKSELM